MVSHLKEILLIGYGAVGAVYSYILKNSGRARVTVVARSNYEVVNESGMHFQSRKYGTSKAWRPDRVFSNIEQALDRPYSYVALATKVIPEIQRTSTLLAPLLTPPYSEKHPQPTYVLLQNGLNVEVDLYQALKSLMFNEEPRIISTAIWIGTSLIDKNIVEHNEFDRVSLGVYRPPTAAVQNTDAEASLLNDFATILSAGGSDTTVVHEIQRVKFAKNMWNGVFGASSALSRFSLRAFFRPPHLEPGREGTEPDPTSAQASASSGEEDSASAQATTAIPRAAPALGTYTIPFLYDALTEVYNLGSVLFPPYPSDCPNPIVPGLDPATVERTLANTARLHARPDSTHMPSMLLDIEAGRPMEVEHVVGEVVRMGRKAGVSMPRMETLYALLLVVQNQSLRRHLHDRAQL